MPVAAVRFWQKKRLVGECWIWTGAISPNGYGKVKVDGRMKSAHRYAYELANGFIPSGMTIDHLCRTRACVRPEHLEVVTHQENSRRAFAVITHCPQGHAYDESNTYTYQGRRQCKACRAEIGKRFREMRRKKTKV